MKIGYSILLSELIASEVINYTDCKSFQIVCPACYEPIFKVEREDKVHYLSHYKDTKTAAENELCELRVKQLDHAEFDAKAGIARDQNLAYFLKFFVDMLKTQTNDTHSYFNKLLKKSKGYDYFEELMMPKVIEVVNDETRYHKLTDHLVTTLEQQGDPLKSSFAIDKQKHIAYDLLKLLMSKKAKVNKRLLMRFTYSNTLSSIQGTINHQPEFKEEFELMLKVIDGITFRGRKDAIEAVNQLQRLRFEQDRNSWELFVQLYFTQLSRSLLILPYFEFLKRKSSLQK